jgi:AbrB family looped-hinge helix DNA binding protein
MKSTTIYIKGQITLPKGVREKVGFKPGDHIVVEPKGDHIIVRKPQGLLEFKAPEPTPVNPMPWHEMRRVAWEEHIERKYGKKKSKNDRRH